MASLILVGNYAAHTYPLTSEINSTTAAAMTGNATYSTATVAFKANCTCRIKRITRLDAATTTDTITFTDSAGNATALVFVMTGTAAGREEFDLGDGVEGPKGGFGITVTSSGTSGTYVIIFDYQNTIA